MNIAKLMIRISALFSVIGIIFIFMFFIETSKYRWGLTAALICIVSANIINLLRMKIVGKKK